jgi:hypothetical protein
MSSTNGGHTFAFKVTQLPIPNEGRTIDTCVDRTRKKAYYALVNALASNPQMFFDLEDEEAREYSFEKGTSEELRKRGKVLKFRIEYHEIRL